MNAGSSSLTRRLTSRFLALRAFVSSLLFNTAGATLFFAPA
jgi:hypothetical protein